MGALLSIQDKALQNLQSDTALKPVRLISRIKGDLRKQVLEVMAKQGICAIVLTPVAKMTGSNAPGPSMDPVNLFVDVVENVLINRGASGSKIPAEDVAERIAWRLHSANHPGRKDNPPSICEEIQEISNEDYLAYRVVFRTSGQLPGFNQETS